MGFSINRVSPMYSNSIELSSDDEVQIIVENKEKTSKNKSNLPVRVGENAIQKLTRNSNIEITIELEQSSANEKDEKPSMIVLDQNYVRSPYFTDGNTLEKEKSPSINGYLSDSSDVIEIIDLEPPKQEVGKSKNAVKPPLPKSSNVLKPLLENSKKNSLKEAPKTSSLQRHDPKPLNQSKTSSQSPLTSNLSKTQHKKSFDLNTSSLPIAQVKRPLKASNGTNLPRTHLQQASNQLPIDISKEKGHKTPNGFRNSNGLRKTPVVVNNNSSLRKSNDRTSKNQIGIFTPSLVSSSKQLENNIPNCFLSDIVYISDDDKSDEESTSRRSGKGKEVAGSYTEQLVNALRENIKKSLEKNNNENNNDLKNSKKSDNISSNTKVRENIIRLSNEGKSSRQIALLVGLGKTTVNELIRKFKAGNGLQNHPKPKPGRPRKTTRRIDHNIKRKSTCDPRRTASEIAKELREEDGAGRVTQPKKKAKEERVAVSEESDFQDPPARVTRSSLSLPPPTPVDEPSSSKMSTSKTRKSALSITSEPMNKYSIENMFSGLVKACKKIFANDAHEEKLWRTFKEASEQVLRSEEFINALKIALKATEETKIESFDDKLMVSREIKEVLRILKRHPEVVDRKVKKLTRMLNLIRVRIRKLEEAEVTSDEEEENNYILLDRYRTRAAKIYDKLCELEGIPSDAGRNFRKWKVQCSGNSGYPKIEQALEKFYSKTRTFPDFFDVRTLVEKTVQKEDLNIPPHTIHNIAQTLFLEFGNKIKRTRCYDDYMILNDYLDEGKLVDPALNNEDLYNTLAKLDSSRKIREAEQKIFDEFAARQLESKAKENDKSVEESDRENESEDEVESEEKVSEKEVLHFSDTDEELINDEVQNGKRKRESSDEDDEEEEGKPKAQKNSHTSGKVNDVSASDVSSCTNNASDEKTDHVIASECIQSES